MALGTVLPEKKALPGTEVTAPSSNRDHQGTLSENRPDVGWHVVGPLESMFEEGIAVWDEPSRVTLKVRTDARISIFTDDERRTGVVEEDRAETGLNSRASDDLLDLRSDLDGPSTLSLDLELFGMNGHDVASS